MTLPTSASSSSHFSNGTRIVYEQLASEGRGAVSSPMVLSCFMSPAYCKLYPYSCAHHITHTLHTATNEASDAVFTNVWKRTPTVTLNTYSFVCKESLICDNQIITNKQVLFDVHATRFTRNNDARDILVCSLREAARFALKPNCIDHSGEFFVCSK
jgi:hypothetical protein